MKRNTILPIIAISLFLTACSSSKKSGESDVTGVWINKEKVQGKTFHNIFIVVMTADIEARSVLENDIAAKAIEKGYKAVKSKDVLPPILSDPKKPAKEDIVQKVKESGCDAVLVAALLKKDEAIRYTPGTTAYSVMPYYSWSGNYFGYYNNWYESVSTPEYYTDSKTYFMQSNLYDVLTEEIIWSVQSKIFEPANLKKFSSSYISELISQLEKAGILKK